MTESKNSIVLAVDGGGTRCRVACEVEGVVQSVEAGSANVSTDFDGSIDQIRYGLSEMAHRLRIGVQDLVRQPAFVGLAGVTDEKIANRVREALGLVRARVLDDRPAALRGALGAKDGLVVHCGTGSFVAAQSGGVMRFAGGWGAILGDEASAQWVGRRALSETLDAVDGIQTSTGLTEHLMTKLGGAAGIVDFAGDASPSDFGALAPQVTSAAASGDKVAQHIMQDGAHYIARMADRLGWRAGVALCLTGGIAPYYADFLPADMRAARCAPLGEPLSGALALAKEVQHEHC